MFGNLLNFAGINWWTLLAGMGLNFVISSGTSLLGAYLITGEATSEFYEANGAPLMLLLLFALYVLSGYIIGKMADDVPVKHAFLSGLGGVVPFLFVAVTTFSIIPLMLAVVTAAGCLNGGMLSVSRRHRVPPPGKS